MHSREQCIAFYTLTRKEIVRFMRIWGQTLLPSPITTTLYFVIFGQLIGDRIGAVNGASYIEYIAPGLIMMAILTNSFANVVSSFFGAKFQKSIEELIVSPISDLSILMGYVISGVARGLMVGLLVALVASFFIDFKIHSYTVCILSALLTAVLFSLGGLINAIFAKKFDDVNIIPAFVLSPLTYLGGVFYSVQMLPPFWQNISHFNPIFYMVNTFRYGFIGLSDVDINSSLMAIFGCVVVLFCLALYLLKKGIGIRS